MVVTVAVEIKIMVGVAKQARRGRLWPFCP